MRPPSGPRQSTRRPGPASRGRFATLGDVVDHYDGFFRLALTPAEKADLIEYLKSI